ncbi:MAG: hypothetical protein H7A23_10550 [Leptospiraceae bacterium]|nr:hypothetical protein [Leptospiraceae bacterium]MCP5494984.1 hypothetical protein [Leptospiraceae bacterium]
MKKYILIVLPISFLLNYQLFSQNEPTKAEPVKAAKAVTDSVDAPKSGKSLDHGLIDDFYLVEEYWVSKHKFPAKEFRLRTLEKNFKTAIRYSLHREFLTKKFAEDIESKVKDITLSKLEFTQERGTFNYYLKYDDHIYFYNFAADPELYIQSPQDERVYPIPNAGGIPNKRFVEDLKNASQERIDLKSSKEKLPSGPQKPNIDSKQ